MILSVTIFKYLLIGGCMFASFIVSKELTEQENKPVKTMLYRFGKWSAITALISWFFAIGYIAPHILPNLFYIAFSFLIFFIPSIGGMIIGSRRRLR